jgi:hypothetical protein
MSISVTDYLKHMIDAAAVERRQQKVTFPRHLRSQVLFPPPPPVS